MTQAIPLNEEAINKEEVIEIFDAMIARLQEGKAAAEREDFDEAQAILLRIGEGIVATELESLDEKRALAFIGHLAQHAFGTGAVEAVFIEPANAPSAPKKGLPGTEKVQ